MKQPTLTINSDFGEGFSQIRSEFEISDTWSPEVQQELETPYKADAPREDFTHLDFITIDPQGSVDLDQALHIKPADTGFTLYYAIADVAEFISPNGAIDMHTRSQGVTYYSPDQRNGLHPPQISEDIASLLAGTTKPALIWKIQLDAEGNATNWSLTRGIVTVSQTYSYSEAQELIDSQMGPETIQLLETVGKLRQKQEELRGGVSIRLKSQEVVSTETGYKTEFETPRPVEGYNAQISLLTGMLAGTTLLENKQGILRTLPPAPVDVITELRQTAHCLGLDWDAEQSYADFVRSLNPETVAEVAFLNQATAAFRGASYLNLASTDETDPKYLEHSAIASVYAHVTAPLRRLVDRFNNEILLSIFTGTQIPEWVTKDIESIPKAMNRAKSAASRLDRAMTNFVEVMVLEDKIGQDFSATVINERHIGGEEVSIVQIEQGAIIAEVPKLDAAPGETVLLKLTAANRDDRKLVFQKS